MLGERRVDGPGDVGRDVDLDRHDALGPASLAACSSLAAALVMALRSSTPGSWASMRRATIRASASSWFRAERAGQRLGIDDVDAAVVPEVDVHELIGPVSRHSADHEEPQVALELGFAHAEVGRALRYRDSP